jgi:hypothetical protein
MSELRADPARLGDAYHELFMGRDTDEAEAAARHLALFVECSLQTMGVK